MDGSSIVTILDTVFSIYIQTLGNFSIVLHQRTVSLSDLEKYFALVNTTNWEEVRTECEGLSSLVAVFLKSPPTSPKQYDWRSCAKDICEYFKFSSSKSVISSLLNCARYVLLMFL